MLKANIERIDLELMGVHGWHKVNMMLSKEQLLGEEFLVHAHGIRCRASALFVFCR